MTDQTLQLLLSRLDHLTVEFHELRDGVLKAVRISDDDPEMALTRARKVLEYVVRDVFKLRCMEDPGTRPLENLLQRLVKDGHMPKRLGAYANYIRDLGNVGTHVYGEDLSKDDVRRSFENLTAILEWYFERVRPDAFTKTEALAGEEEETRRRVEEEAHRSEELMAQELARQRENARQLKEEESRRRAEELERKTQEAKELMRPVKVENAGIESKERAAEEIKGRHATEHVPANMTNRIGMEFVWIPPGNFMMGSEEKFNLLDRFLGDRKPVHRVTISKGFYIGKYEVTQAQWQQVMGHNQSHFKGENLPVEHVDWNEANLFIRRLNEHNDGYTYRLPSEAEWEYACRAGTTGEYAGDLDALAWYINNSGNKTHPVGSKQPNAFGLFDMYGNVWEWVQDWYHNTYEGAPTDGSAWPYHGPDKPKARVVRGGSWKDKEKYCSSSYRFRFDPDWRIFDYIGLRVVAVARS